MRFARRATADPVRFVCFPCLRPLFTPQSDVSEKLAQIVASCSPSLFLTTSEYINALDAGKAYCEQMKEGVPKESESTGSGEAASSSSSSPPPPSHFDLHSVNWTCVDALDYSQSFDPAAPFPDNVGNGYSLAFLQYTSGSTGAPKGVMVGHAHIVGNVAGCTEETRAGGSFEIYRKTVAVSFLVSHAKHTAAATSNERSIERARFIDSLSLRPMLSCSHSLSLWSLFLPCASSRPSTTWVSKVSTWPRS